MSSVRKCATPVLVGVVVFVADLFTFWFIWAEADAVPAAHPAVWPRIAWPIVSFPVFSVTTKNFATVYFWDLAVLNASLWACAAAFIAWKASDRRVAR
jgi:hypothetical protein